MESVNSTLVVTINFVSNLVSLIDQHAYHISHSILFDEATSCHL